MPKTIEVAEITARGSRIEYLLRDETGLGLLRQKSLTAWIEFHNADYFGFMPENVPASILAVPIALYLYPATWFYNVDLVLPTIDKTLYENLEGIYAAYSGLHGPFSPEWRGKVLPSKIEDAEIPEPKFERLVFFSGGVDATHAALNNAGPKNVLASVPSMEIKSAGKDFLEEKSRLIREFSGITGSPWIMATNNLNPCVFNNEKIDRTVRQGMISTAGKGIGFYHTHKLADMLSVAPFAWQQGIRTLVMGSGYNQLEGKSSWNRDGDSPELSDAIKFSGVAFAEQDGLYTRRTEKARNIVNAPLIREFKSAGGGAKQQGYPSRLLFGLCRAVRQVHKVRPHAA